MYTTIHYNSTHVGLCLKCCAAALYALLYCNLLSYMNDLLGVKVSTKLHGDKATCPTTPPPLDHIAIGPIAIFVTDQRYTPASRPTVVIYSFIPMCYTTH